MDNPLLQHFDLAPFSKINNEHYLPGIKALIETTKQEVADITKNPDVPTFKNTIEALENTGKALDRATSIFFNLNSAETNDQIQQIAQEISPLLSNFSNDLLLNQDLFKRVKTIYDLKQTKDLNGEQQMLLEKQYKGFARNGANLSEKKKAQLRSIDTQLSKLGLSFGENVLAQTNAFELLIDKEQDLAGLPAGEKEAAKQIAKEKGKKGWIITLDYPSYVPFMKYAQNRALRKKLALAFGARAFQDNPQNNEQHVLDIVKLRYQRAQLLGYKSHAHFVLEERMAQSPEKVHGFLNELLVKAKPAAQREFNELERFAKKIDGIDQLQKWDSALLC